jgi:hypothetical protein
MRSDRLITVGDIEGMPGLMAALKKLQDDGTKRRRLLAIFRAAAKPYYRKVRTRGAILDSKGRKNNATHRLGVDGKTKQANYTGPGHLRRSMKIKSNKKNAQGFVYVHVGPEAKRKGSGYYGYFLLPGASSRIRKTRDWKDLAWRSSQRAVEKGVERQLYNYLKRAAKRYGFEVT